MDPILARDGRLAAIWRSKLVGVVAALATVAIWAFWLVGTRHAVTTSLDPASLGVLRFAVPALVLAPVWRRTGLVPGGVPPLVLVALMGSGAPFFITVATGMRYAAAADIGPLLAGTMPLFVAMLGVLAFGERLAGWRTAGLALILAGIVAIGGRGLLDAQSGAWRGHLLFLCGALQWAVYTHAFRRSGLTALVAAAIVAVWSLIVLLPFGAVPLAAAVKAGLGLDVVLQAILQGVLSGTAGMVLYGIAVARLGASPAAAFAALTPALAAVLAIPILEEWPDHAALAGIAATTVGVVLASGVLVQAPPPASLAEREQVH